MTRVTFTATPTLFVLVLVVSMWQVYAAGGNSSESDCPKTSILSLKTNYPWVMFDHSQYVRITCRVGFDYQNSFKNNTIKSIYISRKTKQESGDSWGIITSMTSTMKQPKTYVDGITSHGSMTFGKRTSPYLTVDYRKATEDTVGDYICYAEDDQGCVSNAFTSVTGRSNSSFVTKQELSNTIIRIKNNENILSQFLAVIKNFNQTIVRVENKQKELVHNLSNKNKRIEKIENRMSETAVGTSNPTNQQNEPNLNLVWPSGEYTIPTPSTGCPDAKGVTWQESALKFSIKVTGKNSKIKLSPGLRLRLSAWSSFGYEEFTGHINVNMLSCSMVSSDTDAQWPKGSFCVQAYTALGQCPNGFDYSTLQIVRSPSGARDIAIATNLPAIDIQRHYIYVPYCCRQDGYTRNPIDLPNAKPFFLYRFGGKCQQVRGMDVHNQWMHLGVEGDIYDEHRPDIYAKDFIRIELCYYTPRRH